MKLTGISKRITEFEGPLNYTTNKNVNLACLSVLLFFSILHEFDAFGLECVHRDKPLALYVFSTDKKIASAFREQTSSGALVINDTLVHAGCK